MVLINVSMQVIIWTAIWFRYEEPAAPLFWVLVSLFMIFHGLVGVIKPPESYSLDLVINEKKFLWKIPLKHVLGATVNTVIGLAGVISFVSISNFNLKESYQLI